MKKSPRHIPKETGLSLIHFEDQSVRRHWDENAEKWFFSIIDIVGAVSGSTVPKRYWSDLKAQLTKEGFEPYDKIVRLKLIAADGKRRETECADAETLLRIIQSIPSRKANPIKEWLARAGYERMEEARDPEKAIDRATETYLLKGYSPEWVNQRLRSIRVRKELTQEWSERGIRNGGGYAVLTDILTIGWSGFRTKEYKAHKGLKGHNLRDHMTNLELVLNMLAEASTTEIVRSTDAQGMEENQIAAAKGGGIAGTARKRLEETTGKPVISSSNALSKGSDKKRMN